MDNVLVIFWGGQMRSFDCWRISMVLVAQLLLGACAEKLSWREEVRLLSGKSISVERSVDIGVDEWARPGHGLVEYQVLGFTHQDEHVVWSQKRVGFFDDIPIVFDWVEDAPTVVLPLRDWGACFRYGFPASGVVAMSYRNGGWKLLSSMQLLMTLKVNLLQQVRAAHSNNGGVISNSWKDQEDRSGTVRPGMTLAEVSQKLNEAEDSCASMSPVAGRVLSERIERFAAAESTAIKLLPESVSVSTVMEDVSGDEFQKANGKWYAPGYLSPSCQGIVSTMKPLYRWEGDELGARKSLVGTRFLILDEDGQPTEIEFPNSQGELTSVVCDHHSVVTIKRMTKSQLLLHRFSRNAKAKGGFRVDLPDSDSFATDGAWGMVWKPSWSSTDGLSFSIVDYRYPNLANLGGTISHRANFVVRLPDAPH